MGCSVKDCASSQRISRGFCKRHYEQFRRTGSPHARPLKAHGEGTVHRGYLYLSKNGRRMSAQRHAMTDHLGRALLPHESVHHKNGDRLDNRIENLELWSTAQPHGQRVEDKVAWASEIIRLYVEPPMLNWSL